ncbi:MAG TPA: hypothetical protein VFL88_12265 [Gemmatimonadales bacterium]|nr:hypothetical protein [Gemmatimonadales bacterium]
MTGPRQHLTPDEIDSLLAGEPASSRLEHLTDCAECALLLGQHRAVVSSLETLPYFDPGEEFADQVMFQVAVPDPFAMRSMATARRRVLETGRGRALAASVAVALVGMMTASIIWTSLNREVLTSAGSWLGGEATQWFWVALRGAFANVTEQPWFGTARNVLGAPVRLAAVSACIMLLYVVGLMALRRLMAFPSEGAAHAGA